MKTLPHQLPLAICTSLFIVDLLLLLLVGDAAVGLAAAAVCCGGSAVSGSYALWHAVQSEENRHPKKYVQDVMQPVVTLLAILGVALMVQGLGALAGWNGLRSLGRVLAALFGAS